MGAVSFQLYWKTRFPARSRRQCSGPADRRFLVQLCDLLLQGGYHLLLGRGILLQLLDMLLFAVLAQLELLHALQHGAEQRLVRQGLQREVAIAHHQLHPGGVVGGALQPVVGVIAQEQGASTGKIQAVGGHADDAVV